MTQVAEDDLRGQVGRVSAVDHDGNVWATVDVATPEGWKGRGVVRYDGTVWQRFGSQDGLAHDQVNDIESGQRSLWFATDNGVTKLHRRRWSSLGDSKKAHRIMLAKDGRLWASLDDGISIFDGGEWNALTIPNHLLEFPIREIRQVSASDYLVGPSFEELRNQLMEDEETAELIGSIVTQLTPFEMDAEDQRFNTGWLRYANGAWVPIKIEGISSTETLVDLVVTERGDFWFTTMDSGLHRYLPDLTSQRRISGRATRHSGTPISDSWIRVVDEYGKIHSTARTDSSGGYTAFALPGTYQVSAMVGSNNRASEVLVLPLQDSHDVELRVSPLYSTFWIHICASGLVIVGCLILLVPRRSTLLELLVNPTVALVNLVDRPKYVIPLAVGAASVVFACVPIIDNWSAEHLLETYPIGPDSMSVIPSSVLEYLGVFSMGVCVMWAARLAILGVLTILTLDGIGLGALVSIIGFVYMPEWIGTAVTALFHIFGLNAIETSTDFMQNPPMNFMMWRPTSLGHLLGAHDVEESLVSALLWQIEFFGIASIVLTCLALRRCLGARWLHALGIGGICLVLPAAIVFARDSLGAFLPIGVVALLVLFLVLVLRQRKQLKATQLQLIAEMDRELAKAHEMQMSLMPVTGLRTLKFDVAGRCLPASHVGGDYFQYNERDGHLRVSLADVTGHAMEAAIPAVLFSGVLESQEELGGDVGDLFGRLNSPAPRGFLGHSVDLQ